MSKANSFLPSARQAKPFLSAEWRDLAMLNFAVDRELLDRLAPQGTVVDTYDGEAYVSLVGFLFAKTRVIGIPLFFHQQFEEVNLRFYVRRMCGGETRRGVVFIKEIVPAFLITHSARFFYNENYITCPMRHRIDNAGAQTKLEYSWRYDGKWNHIAVISNGNPQSAKPGSIEDFITHHEWGYTGQRDGRCLEYRVSHPRWDVASAAESSIECDGTALYGANLGAALCKPPSSAFVIPGSAVDVYRATCIDGRA